MFLTVYMAVAVLFFTIACILHHDDIHDPKSRIGSFEVMLLVAFLSFMWPYTFVWRPLRMWWFSRGPRL